MNSYEMQEALAEAWAEYADHLAEERALRMLSDPVELYDLVTNYEADIWAELAQVLNDQHLASPAITTLKGKLSTLARKLVEPDCEREAREMITIRGGRVIKRRDEE